MPKCSLYAGIALALVAAGVAGAETEARTLISPAPAAGAISLSVSNEVQAAIDRGLEWLAARQREDGSWSNGMFPALTALPLQALSNSRDPRRQPAADKAVKYILSCVQPDGGIYKTVPGRKGGGLSNYNTAISMTALHATRRRDRSWPVPSISGTMSTRAGSAMTATPNEPTPTCSTPTTPR